MATCQSSPIYRDLGIRFCIFFQRNKLWHKWKILLDVFVSFGSERWCQGRHFNFFLGGQKIFYFLMLPDYWKIEKKQHFICSNLTSFIVPFFLFLFFSLFFLFFLFFFLFFLFFFFLGGATAPQPPKWRLWMVPRHGLQTSVTLASRRCSWDESRCHDIKSMLSPFVSVL